MNFHLVISRTQQSVEVLPLKILVRFINFLEKSLYTHTCTYICMYARIYVHTYTHRLHTNTHMYTHRHACTHAHTHTHTRTHTHTHARTRTHTHTHVHTHTHTHTLTVNKLWAPCRTVEAMVSSTKAFTFAKSTRLSHIGSWWWWVSAASKLNGLTITWPSTYKPPYSRNITI